MIAGSRFEQVRAAIEQIGALQIYDQIVQQTTVISNCSWLLALGLQAFVLLVMLLYFAVADFLYVGRLAAYLCIIEQPDSPPEPVVTMQPISPVGTDSHRSPLQPASEDDILSDIPLRGPAPQPS